jgi:hypothetical protein
MRGPIGDREGEEKKKREGERGLAVVAANGRS